MKTPKLRELIISVQTGKLSFPGPKKQAALSVIACAQYAALDDMRSNIAAIEERHAEKDAEIADLKAKMATMVCKRCGSKPTWYDQQTEDWMFQPCPTCQPKGTP